MSLEIKTINVWPANFILKGAGGVNCYLVKTESGFILIDAGFRSRRGDFLQELTSAGCAPGNLNLIILTHGDLDHTGNCAYLRRKYAAKIAAHRAEARAVESGNMLRNRKSQMGGVAKILMSFIGLISKSDHFQPDIFVEDGDDLSRYGLDAKVIHFPGHSSGSIGILTDGGDLFCGDLLWNIDRPAHTTNIDDPADLVASLEKLKNLKINTVYPGHGRPFLMEQYDLS